MRGDPRRVGWPVDEAGSAAQSQVAVGPEAQGPDADPLTDSGLAPRVRRSAFTLAELPLSALVASLVLMGLAAVAYHCVETLRYVEDLRASHIRAERVFSILRVPLEHCGYGMPADAEEYKRAF